MGLSTEICDSRIYLVTYRLAEILLSGQDIPLIGSISTSEAEFNLSRNYKLLHKGREPYTTLTGVPSVSEYRPQ